MWGPNWEVFRSNPRPRVVSRLQRGFVVSTVLNFKERDISTFMVFFCFPVFFCCVFFVMQVELHQSKEFVLT